MTRFFVVLGIAFIAALYPVNGSTGTELIVSIPDQTVALVDGGDVIAHYRVSTSKFGNGDSAGSYRTPLGTLFVFGKFGDRLPAGTVIKNRTPTGEIIAVDAPNRDAIVSRVIWLRGMEQQNAAAHDRCIYIHGTPEERNIGKAASFGCIRMRSRDIIALYDRVHIGMHVTVSEKLLEELVPCEKLTLLSRAD
ncbi:MAG TPA: L,D-transpeptidase [Chthoniobacterales bacterium]|nr:L,D-transpeptidase [Chthoniobacterales bacterium]